MDIPPIIDTALGFLARLRQLSKQPCLLAALAITAVFWALYKFHWPDHPLDFQETSAVFLLVALVCYGGRWLFGKLRG